MTTLGWRPTHCRRGHRYTAETTYTYKNGRRECRVCIRDRVQRYRRRNLRRVREYQRAWALDRRREQGVGPEDNNRWKNRGVPRAPDEHLKVDAAPFAAWLEEAVEGKVLRDWAAAHDMDERDIYAIRHGEKARLHIDTVDRVLTAAGEMHVLNELYPLEEAVA